MNIAYVWQREDVDLNQTNGPVLHVRAVVEALKRRGHHLRMVTYHNGRPAWSDDLVDWHEVGPRATGGRLFRYFESGVRRAQVELRLPFARLFDSAKFADAVLPALRDRDLIYERHDLLASGGVLAGWRLGLPVVLEINGDIIEEYHEQGIHLSGNQWQVIHGVTQRTFDSAAHIIAVSEGLRDAMLDRWHMEPAKVSVVTNGADLDIFTTPQSEISKGFNFLDESSPLVIHVGSFQPWHSLDLLVDAFARISSSFDARLLFVGDGPLRCQIEEQVEKTGLRAKTIFTGNVPHATVGSLVRQADVAVLAHRPTKVAISGTPLKLLEYMAAGKAIVAPKMANIAAVVEDGQTAILFEPGSAPSLAEAIEKALIDPSLRTRLGCKAQEQVIAHHSWDNTVGKLEQIFTTLG